MSFIQRSDQLTASFCSWLLADFRAFTDNTLSVSFSNHKLMKVVHIKKALFKNKSDHCRIPLHTNRDKPPCFIDTQSDSHFLIVLFNVFNILQFKYFASSFIVFKLAAHSSLFVCAKTKTVVFSAFCVNQVHQSNGANLDMT